MALGSNVRISVHFARSCDSKVHCLDGAGVQDLFDFSGGLHT